MHEQIGFYYLYKTFVSECLDKECRTKDEAKNTPLILAALYIPTDSFKEDSDLMTVCNVPIARGEDETDFIQRGEDEILSSWRSNMRDSQLLSLELPVQQGPNVFTALLELHVDLNSKNHFGSTALHIACGRGITGMVVKLVENTNTKVNSIDSYKNTPLHLACAHGDRKMCQCLIDHHADLKRKNNDGMNPLHVAALEHNLEIVNMFLTDHSLAEFKAFLLEDKDKDGHTPFLLAVKSGDVKVVQCFVNNRADMTAKNKNGANALHLAAMANHVEVLKILHP